MVILTTLAILRSGYLIPRIFLLFICTLLLFFIVRMSETEILKKEVALLHKPLLCQGIVYSNYEIKDGYIIAEGKVFSIAWPECKKNKE